jgi:hypothetical protein
MAFPADFLGCMRTCILSVLWAKKDIYTFFERHGCEKSDIAPIVEYDAKGLNRSVMVDLVFSRLADRADGGLGPLRAMLQSLLTWDHFDPYYFDTIKKLDREEAKRHLRHLKQLQELRDARIKEDRKRRESAEAATQKARRSLEELREEYLALHGGSQKPQARGYALERILAELAKLCGLEVTEPFRAGGEQVDGAVKYEGEHYVVEAKWQAASASNEAVYQFAGKVEGKLHGRGLMFSVHGFSENVLRDIMKGKSLKTIFVDGEDIMLVIEGQLSFSQMIDAKIKAAQTRGLIYVHPIDGVSKLTQ